MVIDGGREDRKAIGRDVERGGFASNVGRNLLVAHAHGTQGDNKGFGWLYKSTGSI